VWAVLIGSEAHGLDPALVAHATVGVTIPMPGETESLNAAVAASIIAYALVIGSGASPSDH
jgi:TrmH family RNA methyltransferase